ncbi:MAG: class I SAM-dependent methyltransferase [Planctomycetota bacterium]
MPDVTTQDMIDQHLQRLQTEGVTHDAATESRDQKRLNITPATGRFLELLITESKPNRILELGTSNGYSTIWIARASSQVGATVDTIECSKFKVNEAKENVAIANLSHCVQIHRIDAGEFLGDCDPSVYDMVFLDADRSRYVDWSNDLLRVVNLGTIVVDNALSHAEELKPMQDALNERSGLATVVLPIGKGQLIIRNACQ